jgi:hypothetical protein
MSKHKTAKGREFNMQAFADGRGETVAVGNSPRNARGDLINSRGDILATTQEITNRVYNKNAKAGGKVVKLNPMEQEVSRKEVIGADGRVRAEVTYADGSVEIIEIEQTKTKSKVPVDFDELTPNDKDL